MSSITGQSLFRQIGESSKQLGRLTLLRDVYRSLLNSGRTYAAFRDEDFVRIRDELSGRGPLLDPMSGYGRATAFCAQIGIPSVAVEFNPPQYLWQLLVHPRFNQIHCDAIIKIRGSSRRWPRPKKRAVVSDAFFPNELQSILAAVFDLIAHAYDAGSPSVSPMLLAASLLTPFSGRLSCTSPGDNSTLVRQGGTCVLTGWHEDFKAYLDVLHSKLVAQRPLIKCIDHELHYGDARSFALGRRKFKSMYTSPPYPNHRDFSSILLPENSLVHNLCDSHGLPLPFNRESIIGSNFVKSESIGEPRTNTARSFLQAVSTLRQSRRGVYDDMVYYLPYLRKYFIAIEKAYENVARFAAKSFVGFIVVVDNTHRGVVIPVGAIVVEIWKELGFQATIHSSKEVFHVGAKNPRAKGIRAKHQEIVVRVWR